MDNRKQIRKKLPHGTIGEIATAAGVSITSVSKWFTDSEIHSETIENAVVAKLEEIAKKQVKQRKRVDHLLSVIV